MNSLLNFIEIYQLVQKLLGGGHANRQTDRQIDRQTGRQIGDLISLTFLLKESRLKKKPPLSLVLLEKLS
jgi:hypothetical protein